MHGGIKAGSLMVMALLAAGCGRDDPREGGAVVSFRPAETGLTPFGEVPFPSDLYVEASGRVAEIPGLERVVATSESIRRGLSALDGFGRSTGAMFFVDAAVDGESLPRTWDAATEADASVLIVDVDPGSPNLGARYPAYAKPLPTLGCISVIPAPGVVLPPGVKHAVVVISRARAADGSPLVADEPLRRIAEAAPSDRGSPAEVLYGEALDELEASSTVASRAEVAGLAVFTTSQQVSELPALRGRLREQPEPELIVDPEKAKPYTTIVFGVATSPSLDDWLGMPDVDEDGIEWPGGDNPGGIAHSEIGAIASGAFVAPSFLDPVTRHFEEDGQGGYLMANPGAMIPVTIVIPKKPAPPGGYPVIINGHGLSNNRGSMFGVANELSRAGFAMIGIDDVLHGARAGIEDVANNFKGGYAGPDGIPDDLPLAAAFFAQFSDFVAVRDNFRQTVLDQVSLVRLIESGKLDLSFLAMATGGAAPQLDASRIYWSGGSLGGIMGAMTTAVEPAIRAAALQVPGASFVQLITTNSAGVAPLVTTLAGGIFGVQGGEPLDEFHPLAHLLAQITEAGDPIAYAPHVMRDPLSGREPPDVLVTYALNDEVLPNVSTVALVRALGVELASPNLVEIPGVSLVASPVSGNVAGRAAAAVQYSPANHGLGYARFDRRDFEPGVPVEGDERFPAIGRFEFEMPIREHERQLVKFFETSVSGSAMIEVTAPPVADFDGDGVLDADDASPWDPSIQ